MAAPYTKAQLHAEVLAEISSKTAPESITPPILGQVLDDIIDSFWNLLDNPGLDNPDANSQGLPGEFVACVADCALQILNSPASNSYADIAVALFPDDRANGSFDNGNNWLLQKYVTAASGFTGKFTVNGLVLKLIATTISGGNSFQFVVEIVKNRLTTPVILATGSVMTSAVPGTTNSFDDTSAAGDTAYSESVAAGTDGAPITLLPGDTVEVVIRGKYITSAEDCITQIISGMFTAQKV